MIYRLNALFPFWVLLLSFFAYIMPQLFTPFKGYITLFLIAIMFFMGATLGLKDFARILKMAKIIILTVALQFFIMPLSALIISKMLGFSMELFIGMILVGSVSGGTASNVITYLAKGDVALSITMTLTSTLLSVIATPFLTLLYVGKSVPVPATDMLLSIAQIVLVPVIFGVIVNYFLHTTIKCYEPYLAIFSMLSIGIIIAIIVSINQEHIATIGLLSIFGVIFHNSMGLTSGYFVTKWLGYSHKICKTVAIEVGMQNSGLAVALAIKYFTPLSALPGAIFSVWHNISGTLLAGYWSRKK